MLEITRDVVPYPTVFSCRLLTPNGRPHIIKSVLEMKPHFLSTSRCCIL